MLIMIKLKLVSLYCYLNLMLLCGSGPLMILPRYSNCSGLTSAMLCKNNLDLLTMRDERVTSLRHAPKPARFLGILMHSVEH